MSGTQKVQGGIELSRATDSIFVGRRHRQDYGDIDELVSSIAREGLLQPITITPDGVLVCGARRLAAIKRLGWTTVNVWVRSGISDRLGQLLAEQDENTLHKPLTKLEAAALYRELKALMAEDAARRKAQTQFSRERQPGADGSANFAGPSISRGESRAQAAAMISGGSSHETYEKINRLQHIADDPEQPEQLRMKAAEALEQIGTGAAVDPLYKSVRTARERVHGDELLRLGAEAVQRAKAAKKQARGGQPAGPREVVPVRFPTRAFVRTWEDLAEWWTHYDIEGLGAELTEEQLQAFLEVVDGTVRFAERLRAAHARGSGMDDGEPRPHLRAL